MVDDINLVCGSICDQIRNIGLIRWFLWQDTCRQVVHASVTSRFDFCNSLLVGLPRYTTGKLQRCQNMAARVITRTRKSEHITPVLRELHWLPAEQRVNLKVLMQVYKALHGLAPDYMVDLLHRYQPGRALRSSTDGHLPDEPWTTTGWGSPAFSKAGPVLWNRLPLPISTASALSLFRKMPKTHLFCAVYNRWISTSWN